MCVEDGGREVASIRMQRVQGHIYCSDFRAEGAAAARFLIRALAHVARRETLHFSIVEDKVHGRLRSLIARFGGRKEFEIWTVSMEDMNGR